MKKILCVLLAVLCLVPAGVGLADEAKNPHTEAAWLDEQMIASLDSIRRVDEKGTLYEMDYTADYYSPVIVEYMEAVAAQASIGCSAFSTYNTERHYMLCRNYDFRHKDASGAYTGMQVVVRTAPEGKLRSIGICDAVWLNQAAYFTGTLDDGVTDTSRLVLAPYMCVDGMNEAGLTASLLLVDLKDGETHTDQQTGKDSVPLFMLLRYIIDNAHDIGEAEQIARSYDVVAMADTEIHIFLTDKSGDSAVFEWRQYGDDTEQTLHVTHTNAVTNFYVGFDDGADAYNADGSLKELCARLTPTFNNYSYGYGHGYHRFNTIIMTLERYILPDADEHGIRQSAMKESQALNVLRVIAQDPGTEKTSFTQFSAIYDLEELTASYWMQQDYTTAYTFGLEK